MHILKVPIERNIYRHTERKIRAQFEGTSARFNPIILEFSKNE